ncbi:hypothetical protein M413DRAFT_448974 [Hebeloma cylindrosporum]|uniref:Uncharacterized protein n=1 Tax=Hebeloma cylindrosporum TaxID=76867 RepID=A0A0C3BYX0_HEBCY|nr:hypothetical protein M413DRAFT_448974 [Hebeloma cylindrosporum h7]
MWARPSSPSSSCSEVIPHAPYPHHRPGHSLHPNEQPAPVIPRDLYSFVVLESLTPRPPPLSSLNSATGL